MTTERSTGGGAPAARPPVLEVTDLRVSFPGADGAAVDGASVRVAQGEALALVGESGSGKSMLSMAIVGLTRRTPARVTGSVRLAGEELLDASEQRLQQVRGARIAMVFQDPATALDPTQRIGRQIAEQIEAHERAPRPEVERRIIELLERVELTPAARIARAYPFELSGGMRQRALIAMAISCRPDLLIADEPTAALDAATQARVLALIGGLKREGMAVLLATHDLHAVGDLADRVTIMRRGQVVEEGPTTQVLGSPHDDYTRWLLRAPGRSAPADRRAASEADRGPLLEVRDLRVAFRSRRDGWRSLRGSSAQVRVADGVTFAVESGETLGLVGESGAGKTTVARAILGLIEPTSGSIRLRGHELGPLGRRTRPAARRSIGAVFQDPAAALNPRRRVAEIVSAPLRRAGVGRADAERRSAEALERVGLGAEHPDRFPHELSGGQRQRVGIARALVTEPELLVLDEPVSNLDAPVRAQIVDLLDRLQSELDLSYLLISHDLDLVERVADRVLVMREGRILAADR